MNIPETLINYITHSTGVIRECLTVAEICSDKNVDPEKSQKQYKDFNTDRANKKLLIYSESDIEGIGREVSQVPFCRSASYGYLGRYFICKYNLDNLRKELSLSDREIVHIKKHEERCQRRIIGSESEEFFQIKGWHEYYRLSDHIRRGHQLKIEDAGTTSYQMSNVDHLSGSVFSLSSGEYYLNHHENRIRSQKNKIENLPIFEPTYSLILNKQFQCITQLNDLQRKNEYWLSFEAFASFIGGVLENALLEEITPQDVQIIRKTLEFFQNYPSCIKEMRKVFQELPAILLLHDLKKTCKDFYLPHGDEEEFILFCLKRPLKPLQSLWRVNRRDQFEIVLSKLTRDFNIEKLNQKKQAILSERYEELLPLLITKIRTDFEEKISNPEINSGCTYYKDSLVENSLAWQISTIEDILQKYQGVGGLIYMKQLCADAMRQYLANQTSQTQSLDSVPLDSILKNLQSFEPLFQLALQAYQMFTKQTPFLLKTILKKYDISQPYQLKVAIKEFALEYRTWQWNEILPNLTEDSLKDFGATTQLLIFEYLEQEMKEHNVYDVQEALRNSVFLQAPLPKKITLFIPFLAEKFSFDITFVKRILKQTDKVYSKFQLEENIQSLHQLSKWVDKFKETSSTVILVKPFVQQLGMQHLIYCLPDEKSPFAQDIHQLYRFYLDVYNVKKYYSPTIIAKALNHLLIESKNFKEVADGLGSSLNTVFDNPMQKKLLQHCEQLQQQSLESFAPMQGIDPHSFASVLLEDPFRVIYTLIPPFVVAIAPNANALELKEALKELAPLFNKILQKNPTFIKKVNKKSKILNPVFTLLNMIKKAHWIEIIDLFKRITQDACTMPEGKEGRTDNIAELLVKNIMNANLAYSNVKGNEKILKASEEKMDLMQHFLLFTMKEMGRPLPYFHIPLLDLFLPILPGLIQLLSAGEGKPTKIILEKLIDKMIEEWEITDIRSSDLSEGINKLAKVVNELLPQIEQNHDFVFYSDKIKQLNAIVRNNILVDEKKVSLEIQQLLFHLIQDDFTHYEHPLAVALSNIGNICPNQTSISPQQRVQSADDKKDKLSYAKNWKEVCTSKLTLENSCQFLNAVSISSGFGYALFGMHKKIPRSQIGTISVISLFAAVTFYLAARNIRAEDKVRDLKAENLRLRFQQDKGA